MDHLGLAGLRALLCLGVALALVSASERQRPPGLMPFDDIALSKVAPLVVDRIDPVAMEQDEYGAPALGTVEVCAEGVLSLHTKPIRRAIAVNLGATDLGSRRGFSV